MGFNFLPLAHLHCLTAVLSCQQRGSFPCTLASTCCKHWVHLAIEEGYISWVVLCWVWQLLWCFERELCCLATLLCFSICFVHSNICLFAEYREKEEEKEENERWGWRLMRSRGDIGQLLQSSISWHNFFSLLLKTVTSLYCKRARRWIW